MKRISVPTGDILIVEGEKGPLECLSLGDYGASHNIKADFLGHKDEISGVSATEIMPLEEKWVITLSTQYGCFMGCKFCDVPKVGKGRNASIKDMVIQMHAALMVHPQVEYTKRLNVHYARMGEPTFNNNVLHHACALKDIVKEYLHPDSLIHPVVSTMLPRNNHRLMDFLVQWCRIKNGLYAGNAGLQFSINSTNTNQRNYLFGGNAHDIDVIGAIGKELPNPEGRKYALNIALADDTIIDSSYLRKLFDPSRFMVKITPLHVTDASTENEIRTTGGYDSYVPYQSLEAELKNEGFDVLVFIPSRDEDEGRITCGNAILSGTMPTCEYEEK